MKRRAFAGEAIRMERPEHGGSWATSVGLSKALVSAKVAAQIASDRFRRNGCEAGIQI